MEYNLNFCNRKIGTVKVEKEGMFYRVSSGFHLDSTGDVFLCAASFVGKNMIGKCIRSGKMWYLTRYLPIKKVGEDIQYFCIDVKKPSRMIPICDNVHFPMLDKLLNARLVRTRNRTMIEIK